MNTSIQNFCSQKYWFENYYTKHHDKVSYYFVGPKSSYAALVIGLKLMLIPYPLMASTSATSMYMIIDQARSPLDNLTVVPISLANCSLFTWRY
jgi:hypothetical protein